MSATIAVHRATAAPPATIRLLPAPRSEPPADHELEAAGVEPPPMNAPLLPFELPSRVRVPTRSRPERLPAPSRTAIGDSYRAASLAGAADRSHQPGGADTGSTGTLATDPSSVLALSPATLAPSPATPDGGPAQVDSPSVAGPAAQAEPALVGAARAPAAVVPVDDAGHAAGSPISADPSPARLATRRFLSTCLEIIGGFRPAAQLRPLCLPEAFADIAKALGAQPTTSAGRWRGYAYAARTPVTGRSTGAPPRAGRTSQTGPGERISVRRVQICETREDAAEVAVVLARREQVWAMALRLECVRDRWVCTHLEVL